MNIFFMKKHLLFVFLCALCLLLTACLSTPTPVSTLTAAPETTITATQVPSGTQTSTSMQTQTQTPEATIEPDNGTADTPTALATDQPTAFSQNGDALVIDHKSVELFDQIPDEYIQAASEITWYHRHASVGVNMRFGLDCIFNFFPDRADPNRRPHACDRDLSTDTIVFDQKYDSSNWEFELHATPNANPGWNNKINYFVESVDNLNETETFDYASFNFGYVEDDSIINHFFTNTDPNDNFPGIWDLEQLEARHPDIEFIYWTIALARQTDPHILEFNEQLRQYARDNGKILMDIASIESHTHGGEPCTGIDQNQNPTDLTAICEDYVEEIFAGHLNSLGSNRMARAIWVMMAQLAGWEANGK